ncbi:hypothetical protein O0L34_g12271 [Tuta absoluta]|nr:hypothetical protein O0L34_g12271 [Tuta absoluta]
MGVHLSNPSITKSDFVIISRPTVETNKLLPQSDIVSATENITESNTINDKVEYNKKDDLAATTIAADSTTLSQLQEKCLNANNEKKIICLKKAIELELDSKILKTASALSDVEVINLNNTITSETSKKADNKNDEQQSKNNGGLMNEESVPINKHNMSNRICDDTSANMEIEIEYSKGLQFEDYLGDIVEIDESNFGKNDKDNISYHSDDSRSTVILEDCELFGDTESEDLFDSANRNKDTKVN